MPTADQLIAWSTTLLIVLTGIVDAYRKWRATHGPPSDEVARLRDENAWLWQELVRLRHLLGEAEADRAEQPELLERDGVAAVGTPRAGTAGAVREEASHVSGQPGL
jgi:hypothetical protein